MTDSTLDPRLFGLFFAVAVGETLELSRQNMRFLEPLEHSTFRMWNADGAVSWFRVLDFNEQNVTIKRLGENSIEVLEILTRKVAQ